ncbi:DUF4192 family protein [Microbacterium radiodurans]|uniref:DUF4192 family protein n=1 Tax=Microbacterium radiodurans TaxID=661398 RepID=A0A5J5IW19_9MICO|nr:DUF4192 family protein [Microbacterium radiodurans]KAA9089456.1 DUF4192 family protein [Microbacterium radiodurans]
MTTTVSAAGAAHFLSLVPLMLGFTPTDSLVIVPFAGSTSLGALRVDLAEDEDRDLGSRASTVLGMVCRIPDATGLAAIAYSPRSAAAALPGAPQLREIRLAAEACGIRVVDLLTVASDGWGSHLGPETPARGRPLREIDAARRGDAVARRAAARRPPRGDQASGSRLPGYSSPDRRAVAAALESVNVAAEAVRGILSLSGGGIAPTALATVLELDDPPELFENALDLALPGVAPADLHSSDPDLLRIALLIWCLARPSLRDIALVQWVLGRDGGDDALVAQQGWEDGEAYPEHLAAVVWGDGERPDPVRLERALELVRHLASLAGRAERPGPLALCAWLSWALGRSTHADRYARRALEIDPDHGLAEIILTFVQNGHLPDWAFRARRTVR